MGYFYKAMLIITIIDFGVITYEKLKEMVS